MWEESLVASEQGPFYRALGGRIRQARSDAKISQDSLARAVGLSRTSITNIEKGRQPVQVHLLVKIADALGATSASLLPAQPKDARRVSGEALRKLPAESKRWVEKVLSTTAEPTRNQS
jgi:transcriptional regulator with XRE-family HTH domain